MLYNIQSGNAQRYLYTDYIIELYNIHDEKSLHIRLVLLFPGVVYFEEIPAFGRASPVIHPTLRERRKHNS